jgi:hypothetical protein
MPHQGQTGITFTSHGHKLLGTLYLAPGDEPKPTVLLLHGLPGIEKNVDIALTLRENGINSVIFHYRGCWGSAGIYNLPTLPDDVIAAVDYLTSGAHPQVDHARLAVAGHSMGGWAAVLAACRDDRLRAAAVYGAVCEPAAFAWSDAYLNTHFLPWLPGLTRERFRQQWAILSGDARFSLSAQADHLASRPLLILHAKGDEVVSFAQAEALHRAAPFATLHPHEEANHAYAWHRPYLRDTLLMWAAQHISPAT